MLILAILGGLILSMVVAWGVWSIFKFFRYNHNAERYIYEETIDKDGKKITKVTDLTDTD